MACTCRHCLELAAQGAELELLKCVAQDAFPPVPSAPPSEPPPTPLEPTLVQPCPIQRLQIVPFGVDAASAELLEDPDERAYIWELDHGGHPSRNH